MNLLRGGIPATDCPRPSPALRCLRMRQPPSSGRILDQRLAKELIRQYEDYAARCDVLPWDQVRQLQRQRQPTG